MEEPKYTATLVRRMDDWRGDAALYHVEPNLDDFAYVIASSIKAFGGSPETYLFAASRDGDVVNWCEMTGSRKGEWTHAETFEAIGYSVVTP